MTDYEGWVAKWARRDKAMDRLYGGADWIGDALANANREPQPWQAEPAIWQAAEQTDPIVTLRCVISGCGLRLAGIFVTEDARPLLMWAGAAHVGVSVEPWIGGDLLDVAGDRGENWDDALPMWCHRHGFWSIPRLVLLEYWSEARSQRPIDVKLDRERWFLEPDTKVG